MNWNEHREDEVTEYNRIIYWKNYNVTSFVYKKYKPEFHPNFMGWLIYSIKLFVISFGYAKKFCTSHFICAFQLFAYRKKERALKWK